MALLIHTVNSASTQVNFKYLDSHHLFGLEVVGNYTFDITELEYNDGIAILEDAAGFDALQKAYSNQHLVAKIGTDIFHAGVITSLSLNSSSQKNHNTATITIKETKRVEDDGELSYLNASIPSPQKVQSFSDTVNFNRTDGSVSYSRRVSLQYDEDLSEEFLNNAYMFLKNIYYTNRPNFGYQVDGLSEKTRMDGGFRPQISEEYDLINKSISFGENLTFGNVQGSYSKSSSYTLGNTENGFLQKSYNVDIVGLIEPTAHSALNGLTETIDLLAAENLTEFGSPVSISKNISKDSSQLTATVTFNTDPQQNQTDTFTYSASRTQNASFFDYSISTNRKSSAKDKATAYSNLKSKWASEQALLKEKISALFPEVSTGELFEISRALTFDPFEISLSENVTFSTNPDYDTSGDTIKSKTSINSELPVERIHEFNVPKDKARVQRLFRDSKNSLGKKQITVELVKKQGSDLIAAEAEALAIALQPPAGTSWVSDKSSSIDPKNGTTTATISYNYFY